MSILHVGGYLIVIGVWSLIRIQADATTLVSERASARVRETIIHMAVFCLLMLLFVAVSIACHIYTFIHSHDWKESFHHYIL